MPERRDKLAAAGGPTTIQVVMAMPMALEPSNLVDAADTLGGRFDKLIGQYLRVFDCDDDAAIALYHILSDLIEGAAQYGIDVREEIRQALGDAEHA